MKVSSGYQRTLRFAQYLPESDWQPIILAPHPRAYPVVSDDLADEASRHMEIYRTFVLDSGRHLSFAGRFPRIAAVPDRWSTWWLGAVPTGLRLIRQCRPDVIWSTYPIATAHLIGLTLHNLSNLPWIADFRDPMAQEGYPPDPLTWRSFKWIEKQVARRAQAMTFTTPGAIREYARRYPESAHRFSLIENGYDESSFVAIRQRYEKPVGPLTLLHSGLIYPSERDPTKFFAALSHLLRDGTISHTTFRLILRATGCDTYLQQLIRDAGIEGIVAIMPAVTYSEALAEMLSVDGLLILQASNCNEQIPAKFYEYLRARRPIFALTDPAGDTANALRAAGIDTIARLDSEEHIVAGLKRFLRLLRTFGAPIAGETVIAAASRRNRTIEFAELLNRLVRNN